VLAQLLFAAIVGLPSFKPQLEYRLTVDPANFTGITVELRMLRVPAGLTLAAPAHPEYDDKYWRYLEGLEAKDQSGNSIAITRSDSVLWKLSNPAGDVVVRYRVRFPQEPAPRAAWRAFLTSSGGLVGGPHSFLYPLGLERAGATLTLALPPQWTIATSLQSQGGSTFSAPDLHTLMESPLQVGIQSEWHFTARGLPHRVFYWRAADARPFDTTAFVKDIEKIVNGALEVFGSAPYSSYTFMFQDGAYGGLEHLSSFTLGAPSADLATNPHALGQEIAHEYFHSWNLMSIKPVEYRGLDYRTQPPVAALWFNEGFTMFYADLLLRRGGIPAPQPTRAAHLEGVMARYWNSSGHVRFSAEEISRVAYNAGPGALGDYSASPHAIGELIGAMLDLQIRESTRGARSLDDVMRLMYQRHGGKTFTSTDVQRAVEETCRCQAEIFARNVFAAGAIDFDRYLATLGLKADLTWETNRDQNDRPFPDLRLQGYQRPGESIFRLVITDPRTIWAKAGLHSHDVLVSFNGKPLASWPELRTALRGLTVGDTATVVVVQQGNQRTIRVPITAQDRPVVKIVPRGNFTPDQKRAYQAWSEGK
jgi:predicted metalloprotease with PDZ domain